MTRVSVFFTFFTITCQPFHTLRATPDAVYGTDRKNKLHFPVRPPVSQIPIKHVISTFSAHEPPKAAPPRAEN